MMFISMIGCTTSIKEYENTNPKMNFQSFFSGKLVAHGIIKNRSGKMTMSFVVNMDCEWKGNQGLIKEKFLYSNGTESTRDWRITILPNGEINGVADDVVGVAKGRISGSAFYWNYHLLVPFQNSQISVHLDDWMFLIDEKVIINHTQIS